MFHQLIKYLTHTIFLHTEHGFPFVFTEEGIIVRPRYTCFSYPPRCLKKMTSRGKQLEIWELWRSINSTLELNKFIRFFLTYFLSRNYNIL